jgi:hypothetical protein
MSCSTVMLFLTAYASMKLEYLSKWNKVDILSYILLNNKNLPLKKLIHIWVITLNNKIKEIVQIQQFCVEILNFLINSTIIQKNYSCFKLSICLKSGIFFQFHQDRRLSGAKPPCGPGGFGLRHFVVYGRREAEVSRPWSRDLGLRPPFLEKTLIKLLIL